MKSDALVPSRAVPDRVLEKLVDVEIRLFNVEREVAALVKLLARARPSGRRPR